jgi:glutathione peroxidase
MKHQALRAGLVGVTLSACVLAIGLGMGLQPKDAPAKQPETKQPETKQPDAKSPETKQPETKSPEATELVTAYVLGYTMKTIEGQDKALADYKGKVIVVVNVASKCGYTPQYKGLQKLYDDNKDKGLVVLGFPANNFGGQEPGTEEQIQEFCSKNFGVNFPMFAKVSVAGKDAHPLFKQLAAQPAPIGGEPKWNFTKFIVDRKGNVVARFESRVKPDDEEFLSQLRKLLDEKV